MPARRRYPVGAEPTPDGSSFRVWAPKRRRVFVVLEDGEHSLEREPGGYFSGLIAAARPGARYRFRLDDDAAAYADPPRAVSRRGRTAPRKSSIRTPIPGATGGGKASA